MRRECLRVHYYVYLFSSAFSLTTATWKPKSPKGMMTLCVKRKCSNNATICRILLATFFELPVVESSPPLNHVVPVLAATHGRRLLLPVVCF